MRVLISPDCANYALSDSPIAAKALDFLDTHFKNIPSLKEIIINFEVHPEQDPSDDLTKKMHDCGWTVKVTKLPKKKWISLDDRVEFDNEEDCQAYDNEQFLIDERERQREEKSSGLKNIIGEDAIPIGRTIQTTIDCDWFIRAVRLIS